MSIKTQVAARGISFGGMLTLIVVVAKLWDRIDWSWVWVCSPMWIPAGIVASICAVMLVVAGLAFAIAGILDGFSNAKRARARRKAAKP